MKNAKNSIFKVVLSIVLFALVLLSYGCGEQPGETAAEGHRRHQRIMRMSKQQMIQDIDRAMLFDKPSKLSDKRTP